METSNVASLSAHGRNCLICCFRGAFIHEAAFVQRHGTQTQSPQRNVNDNDAALALSYAESEATPNSESQCSAKAKAQASLPTTGYVATYAVDL